MQFRFVFINAKIIGNKILVQGIAYENNCTAQCLAENCKTDQYEQESTQLLIFNLYKDNNYYNEKSELLFSLLQFDKGHILELVDFRNNESASADENQVIN